MAESPRAVDLRLTIPADAPYRDLASELATKFAEYAGCDRRAAAALGEAVARIAQRVSAGAQPMDIEMERRNGKVIVRASSGSRHDETSCPLPD